MRPVEWVVPKWKAGVYCMLPTAFVTLTQCSMMPLCSGSGFMDLWCMLGNVCGSDGSRGSVCILVATIDVLQCSPDVCSIACRSTRQVLCWAFGWCRSSTWLGAPMASSCRVVPHVSRALCTHFLCCAQPEVMLSLHDCLHNHFPTTLGGFDICSLEDL